MSAVQAFPADLIAVPVAVTGGEPRLPTVQDGRAPPLHLFEPRHRSRQLGPCAWVEQQAHHPLGYVAQLRIFADPSDG